MWANKYVGLPWAWKGRTSEGVDCYGLLRLVYRDERGIALPEHQYLTVADASALIDDERNAWLQVDAPTEFDVGIRKTIQRAGGALVTGWHLVIFAGAGAVLEAIDPVGVVIQPVPKVEAWVRHSG